MPSVAGVRVETVHKVCRNKVDLARASYCSVLNCAVLPSIVRINATDCTCALLARRPLPRGRLRPLEKDEGVTMGARPAGSF